MKLIDLLIINEYNYLKKILEDEGISEQNQQHILETLELDPNETYTIEYLKDDKGNLYKYYYRNGQRITSQDLPITARQFMFDHETKTKVLFV